MSSVPVLMSMISENRDAINNSICNIKEYVVVGANPALSKQLVSVKDNKVFTDSHFTPITEQVNNSNILAMKKIREDKLITLLIESGQPKVRIVTKQNKTISFGSSISMPIKGSGYSVGGSYDIAVLDESHILYACVENHYSSSNGWQYQVVLTHIKVNFDTDSITIVRSLIYKHWPAPGTNAVCRVYLETLTSGSVIFAYSISNENKNVYLRNIIVTPSSISLKGSETSCGQDAVAFKLTILSPNRFVIAYYAKSWYYFGYSNVASVDENGSISVAANTSFRHENGMTNTYVDTVRLSDSKFAIHYYGQVRVGSVDQANKISYTDPKTTGLNIVKLVNCSTASNLRVLALSGHKSNPADVKCRVLQGELLDMKSSIYVLGTDAYDCKNAIVGDSEGIIIYNRSDMKILSTNYSFLESDVDDIGIVINDTPIGSEAKVLLSGVCDEFTGVHCGQTFERTRVVARGLAENSIVVKPYWEV